MTSGKSFKFAAVIEFVLFALLFAFDTTSSSSRLITVEEEDEDEEEEEDDDLLFPPYLLIIYIMVNSSASEHTSGSNCPGTISYAETSTPVTSSSPKYGT